MIYNTLAQNIILLTTLALGIATGVSMTLAVQTARQRRKLEKFGYNTPGDLYHVLKNILDRSVVRNILRRRENDNSHAYGDWDIVFTPIQVVASFLLPKQQQKMLQEWLIKELASYNLGASFVEIDEHDRWTSATEPGTGVTWPQAVEFLTDNPPKPKLAKKRSSGIPDTGFEAATAFGIVLVAAMSYIFFPGWFVPATTGAIVVGIGSIAIHWWRTR